MRIFPGIFFFPLAVALTGCLPPGTPPPGNIVENTPAAGKENDQPLSFPETREKILTDLIPVFMLFCQGKQVYPQGDGKTAKIIRLLAKESAAFSGAKVVDVPTPAACFLHSGIREKKWRIRLHSPQQELLWEREYPLADLP